MTLSARAAATRLGVDDRTVRGWIASGRLPAQRNARGGWAIAEEDVDQLAAETARPPRAEPAAVPAPDVLALLIAQNETLRAENRDLARLVGLLQGQLLVLSRQQDQLALADLAQPPPGRPARPWWRLWR